MIINEKFNDNILNTINRVQVVFLLTYHNHILAILYNK